MVSCCLLTWWMIHNISLLLLHNICIIIIIIRYPADKSQKNLKGQSTQVIWIENYNCIAVAMGPKNQTHLKCSPKELATVVCALRTIVTTCTKNDYCHHSQNMRTAGLRAILVMKIGSHNNLDDFVSIWRRFIVLSILETAKHGHYGSPHWHTFRT